MNHCVVHVFGWEPGQSLGILETRHLSTAAAFARKETKSERAAFATIHVQGERTVRLYARGRLSRRLSPRSAGSGRGKGR